MNTTKIISPELAEIIAKEHYVPTPADCLEAGMINPESDPGLYLWVDRTLPDNATAIMRYLKCRDAIDFIFRPDDGSKGPYLMDFNGNIVRELVFANRDACMAFLRNHMVTAEQGGLN